MPVGKKLRFEIFKRDGFKCQYCGLTPPNIVLEVDHIIPKSKKGTDEIDNLITSCFDCNRGKGNRELNCLPQSTAEKTKQIKDKEEQYAEYKKILAKVKKRENSEIEAISEVFSNSFPDWNLTDRFKNTSLRSFIKQLGEEKVSEAMHTACGRISDSSQVIKYFCGICWNMINNPHG